ncbi:3-dehydroquinate dehydratase [Arenicella chitinivorans]|uniref:3-dehydroquinate dehydratase n=1 Tax=Arenicella chitinivorans TaxID=1329800 RepID=A0A918RXH5_9GAMM|nr:type II 3-dehydroquinate dehydratase [Arenicella chitinivorans]GHA15257.1 3-dehydroquinate dehydratase [Arenicella chitinivorans]
MKILIVNGPNLNLLGEREPEVYGSESLADVNAWIRAQPESEGHELVFFQSNHEGVIIDHLQAHRREADAVIINPGGLTHYSVALRDAISGCQIPTVEVHLSDIHAREAFRQVSMIKDVCLTQIAGRGKQGYVDALAFLNQHLG